MGGDRLPPQAIAAALPGATDIIQPGGPRAPQRRGFFRNGARRAACACRPARRAAVGTETREPRSLPKGLPASPPPERLARSHDGARRVTCACHPARRGAVGTGTAEPRSESHGAAKCGADNGAMIFTVYIQNISKYICAQFTKFLQKSCTPPRPDHNEIGRSSPSDRRHGAEAPSIAGTDPSSPVSRHLPATRRERIKRAGGSRGALNTGAMASATARPAPASRRRPSPPQPSPARRAAGVAAPAERNIIVPRRPFHAARAEAS